MMLDEISVISVSPFNVMFNLFYQLYLATILCCILIGQPGVDEASRRWHLAGDVVIIRMFC